MDLYKYIKDHSTPQTEALDWIERQTNIGSSPGTVSYYARRNDKSIKDS